MGKSKAQKVQVADYYMTIHYGACVGPVDSIREVRIAEKSLGGEESTVLYGGFEPILSSQVSVINLKGLFGGHKEAGGVYGILNYLFGNADQVMPEEYAAKLGRTPTTMPGYRNTLSFLFSGSPATLDAYAAGRESRPGFLWGANNPIIPNVDAVVERQSHGPVADVPTSIGAMGDTNPAFMIYECLTNTDWGMGAPASEVNADSFLSAALTLVDEAFGLSMVWTQQISIDLFIGAILEHINGVRYVDPETGKWNLKLLRPGYNPDTLPVINPSNSVLQEFQRKGWGETINEVVLSWTNPATEQAETVTVHDLANIAIQGQIVSTSTNREGIRNVGLAQRVAERELTMQSLPLALAEVESNRTLSNLRPGDPARLIWPEDGINLIVRIGEADFGRPGDEKIKFSLTEDVFAFGPSKFSAASSEWVDPDTKAVPVEDYYITTAPFYALISALGASAAENLEFPETRALILAGAAAGTFLVNLLSEETDVLGGLSFQPAGDLDPTRFALLAGAIGFEVSTSVAVSDLYGGSILSGMFVFLTDGTREELCLVTAVSDPTHFVMRRGILDTQPLAWPVGARMFFISLNARLLDIRERVVGQSPRYKLLPVTALGQLDPADAPIITADPLTDRPYRPTRPANFSVGGILGGGPISVSWNAGTIETAWSRRNRLMESASILAWNDADMFPEEDQTHTLQIRRGATVLHTYAGLTIEVAKSVPLADLGGFSALVDGETLTAAIWASRDGYLSAEVTAPAVLTLVYHPDAEVAFAAMSVQPPKELKRLIHDLIIGLIDDNIWSVTDILRLWNLHTLQASTVNIKRPTQVAVYGGASAPIFTKYQGTDVSEAGSYYNSQFNPITQVGVKMSQNSWALAAWTLEDASSTTYIIGHTNLAINPRRNSSPNHATFLGGSSTADDSSSTISDSTGLTLINRVNSSEFVFAKNGADIQTITRTSAALANASIYEFNRNNAGTAGSRDPRGLAFTFASAGLNGTQRAALYSRLSTFKTAVALLPP